MTTYSDPSGGGAYGALDTTTSSATWLYGSLGYPSVNSVNQGCIGDCWYMSALICMATFDPTYLESMITADGGGYYTVELYFNGVAQSVTIADDLPNDASSGNGYGNWAPLIEKAYAAVEGSYTAMNGNTTDTAFGALTDQSCTDLSISSGNTASIASQIEAAVSAGKGVEIYSDDLFVPAMQPANDGLTGTFPEICSKSWADFEGMVLQFASGSHAYAVVGYDSVTGNLIVRNPWGYTGIYPYNAMGQTFPNAYVSTNNVATSDLTAPPDCSGTVTGGVNIDYFSEFEISVSDLQYFSGGAITNSPLPTAIAVAPTVNVQNVSVAENASISESAFVMGVTNPSDDSITEYGFRDAGGGSGYLTLSGVAESDGSWVDVTTANLSTVQYVGGSSAGADTLDVEVFDTTTGTWSASASLTATTTAPHVAPTVNVQNVSVAENASISESAFVTGVTNPNGDSITDYGFYDAGGGSGYLTLKGFAQSDGRWVYVTTGNLSLVQYVGGSSAGADTLDVEVLDGATEMWSATASLTATTTAPYVAPTVTAAPNVTIAEGELIRGIFPYRVHIEPERRQHYAIHIRRQRRRHWVLHSQRGEASGRFMDLPVRREHRTVCRRFLSGKRHA